MDGKDFVKMLAGEMTREITANQALGNITRNTSLIGSYAEASVRRMIRNVVAPLRVSHGSVIYEGNCGTGSKAEPPQIDTIIWARHPVPAIFEVGDFALVPRGSAVTMLEIKSTNYPGATDAIEKTCEHEGPLMFWHQGNKPDPNNRRAMGVICVRATSSTPPGSSPEISSSWGSTWSCWTDEAKMTHAARLTKLNF